MYKATDGNTGRSAAVKFEKPVDGCSYLSREFVVYSALDEEDDKVGLPRFFHYGREGDYDVLVIERLGSSLYQLRSDQSRGLSNKSVLMIGIQALKRIETLHSAGFIHRDITPMNMLMGYRDADRVYLVDFGLAKRYIDEETGIHIPYRTDKCAMGTELFSSSNSHFGKELSRRDDLEGLGFSLVYLFRGLPWKSIRANGERSKQRKIAQMKKEIAAAELCRGMSSAFVDYFEHVRSLRFYDEPNYSLLRDLFEDALFRRGVSNDRVFDWME